MNTANDPGEAAVPAGWRVGDGWRRSAYRSSRAVCDRGSRHSVPMFFEQGARDGIYAWCFVCAVEMGALVPVEPPVAEPPGFRVVGRSGPDVPLPSIGTTVRFARYSDMTGESTDAPRKWTAEDEIAGPVRQWLAGCFDILEPIPAAPDDERIHPAILMNAQRSHSPPSGRLISATPVKVPAPVAEPAQPVCKANCGMEDPDGPCPFTPCFDSPGADEHMRHFCTERCGDRWLSMNRPPVPPGPVPPEGEPEPPLRAHVTGSNSVHRFDVVPTAAPAKAPLSERMRVDREELMRLLLLCNAGGGLRGGELGTLARFGFHEDEARSLADQLATAIRERDEQRGRAERAEELHRNLSRLHVEAQTEAFSERDKAREEVEQLRAKLEEAERECDGWRKREEITASELAHVRETLADVEAAQHQMADDIESEAEREWSEKAKVQIAAAYCTGWADGAEKMREATAKVALGQAAYLRSIDRTKYGDGALAEAETIANRIEVLPIPVCPEGPPAGTRCGNLDCGPNCTHGMSVVCGHDDEDSECNNQRCAQADAIKAAVDKGSIWETRLKAAVAGERERCARGFYAWCGAGGKIGAMNAADFEAWIRSGAPAPGAGKP